MKLHENQKLFRQAIRFTADKIHLPAIFVEKDYWVTLALFSIFHDEIGKDTVFKGGTALSKCYGIIERFSEDIDLVVLRRDGETNNQLKSKLKAVGAAVERVLPETAIRGITNKKGMIRKTAHSFNKEFNGNYGQIRDVIVLETTWLGYHEPYTVKSIVSFVGQMMLNNKQTDMAEKHGLLPFDLLVLEPIRTVCEKIMSLVRFSYQPDPINDLSKKIRHIYDLHQLLKIQEYKEFFNSPAFDAMLLKVANDDVEGYKKDNDWLNQHPNEAYIFKDLETAWDKLKKVYANDFKNMVYGELPKEEAVFDTLKRIKERLKNIPWTLTTGRG